jgi:hypothetical protein
LAENSPPSRGGEGGREFPRIRKPEQKTLENVEWKKHLAKEGDTVKARPFPEFMNWLEEVGASWEMLAAEGTEARKGGGTGAYYGGFYGDPQEDEDMKCFKCGDSGHFKRDCPKLTGGGQPTGGGGGGGRG